MQLQTALSALAVTHKHRLVSHPTLSWLALLRVRCTRSCTWIYTIFFLYRNTVLASNSGPVALESLEKKNRWKRNIQCISKQAELTGGGEEEEIRVLKTKERVKTKIHIYSHLATVWVQSRDWLRHKMQECDSFLRTFLLQLFPPWQGRPR